MNIFNLLSVFVISLMGINLCSATVNYDIKMLKFEKMKLDNIKGLNWTGMSMRKIDKKTNAIYGTMEIFPYKYENIVADIILYTKINNEYKESAIQMKGLNLCEYFLKDKLIIPEFIKKSDLKRDKCFEPKIYHVNNYVPKANEYFPSSMPNGKEWKMEITFKDKTDGSILNSGSIYFEIDNTKQIRKMMGK